MCEKLLSQVQIAGAGAGKTYSLAEKVLMCYENKKDDKVIYVIAFTNDAKINILRRMCELNNGQIPANICIETIHSFLLNELLYPFSKYYFGRAYSKATSMKLPTKPQLQRYQIKKLNEIGIIHNSQVFNKAKQMIVCRKGETNAVCNKKKTIIEYLQASIGALFIDEAQDLDEDALALFETLAESIYLYIVGDPKQAIKYPHAFRNFTERVLQNNVVFQMLPFNTVTRRIPECHLRISNLFCPSSEEQTTISDVEGKVFYMFSSDENFLELYKLYQARNALIYIRQETEIFSTQNYSSNFSLEESICEKLLEKVDSKYDKDAYLKTIEKYLINITLKKDAKKAIQSFTKKFQIGLEKNEYAKLINDLTFEDTSKKIQVKSIDKVKGLENELCMFIIDNALLEYLFKNKLDVNKEMMRLYVALTRSKSDLILVVDESSLKKKNRKQIDAEFGKLEIEYLNSGYMEPLKADREVCN